MPPSAAARRFLEVGLMAIDPKAYGLEQPMQAPAAKPYEEKDGLAILHVDGPLVSTPHPFWQDYQTIEKAAAAAFKSNARAVELCIDSPGGSASGCFELSRALRKMSEATGKRLGVFVRGQACSAAFAIAAAATKGYLWAPPTSLVGNIGVFEALVDATAADAQMGLKFVFVVSEDADLKLAGNPHVPLSQAVADHQQAQVNILTGLFYEILAEMRGIGPDEARGLRGAALLASQAAGKGLVDSVGTYGAFAAELLKGKPMTVKAAPTAQASKATDEEWNALRTLAESDDEDNRKMAKKMLSRMVGAGEDTDGDGDGGKDTDKDGASKAEKEDGEKEDAEGSKAAAAAGGAQASSATPDVLVMAKELHELKVKDAARDHSARVEGLLAKRPDFSAEVRATLAASPIPVIEKAVATWPRIQVTPLAAANATTPGVTPGEKDGVTKALSTSEQAMLDRLGRNMGPRSQAAHMVGNELVLDPMSPEAAAKRVNEMIEAGTAPKAPIDAASVMGRTFKVAGK